MADVFHRRIFLEGPAGQLEALLWTTATQNPARVAVVCHPHPLLGGTLHNKVVFQTAKTLHSRGYPVLRFNFRGAGQSAGTHDKGRGEADDVRIAIDYLAQEFPATAIIVAGFSFGAWVGLKVGCQDARVQEVIGLGIPVNDSDLNYLKACTKPKLIIQGAKDQFGAKARVESLFDEMPNPKQLMFIPEADHFFTGKLDQVSAAISTWLDEFKTLSI
jgi:alpha/beta superfamily hydrolase